MGWSHKFLLVVFQFVEGLLLNFREVFLVVDEGSPEVNDFYMQVISNHDVLRF